MNQILIKCMTQNSQLDNKMANIDLIKLSETGSSMESSDPDYSAFIEHMLILNESENPEKTMITGLEDMNIAQFLTDSDLTVEQIKYVFEQLTPVYHHHDDAFYTIAFWSDYDNGRSLRIGEKVYQQGHDNDEVMENFEEWIEKALEEI